MPEDLDLDKIVDAAFSEQEGAGTTDDAAATDTATTGAEDEAAAGGSARARDEHGRFTAADKSSDKGKPPAGTEGEDGGEGDSRAADDQGDGQDISAADDAPGEGTEPLEPLANWPAAIQETFRKQPREVQQFMLDRHAEMERDYHAKTQEVAPLRQTFDKWGNYIRQTGSTPEQAFNTLMETEYVLRTGTPAQKQQVFINIANTYGVPIPSGGAASADVATEDDDPIAAHPVIRRILEGQTQISSFLTNQARGQQQATLTTSHQAIEAFQNEKDASGKAAHPYFPEVVNDMVALAHADRAMGKTPDLKSLYDRAVYANPEVRAKVMAADKAASAKAEADRKREDARKARKTSVSVTGSPSSTQAKPKTLEETVAEAMTGTA